jgi:hypothetical protein
MPVEKETIADSKRQRRAPYQPSAQRWELSIAVKERAPNELTRREPAQQEELFQGFEKQYIPSIRYV